MTDSSPANPAPVPASLVDRLAKVAGLLGSDHDGERSAAPCARCRPSVTFGWRALASACLEADDALEALTDWERGFLVDLRVRAYP